MGTSPESSRIDRETEYVASLENFLDHSGEDTVDAQAILSQLPRFAPRTYEAMRARRRLRVLDVGAGNGAKACFLARRLRSDDISVMVDSIEPKGDQRRHLEASYAGGAIEHLGRVFDRPLAEAQGLDKYDLVLVIHSLYEFPRLPSPDDGIGGIERLRSVLAPGGAGVVVVEHPDGDFQRLKRDLYPTLGLRPAVSQALITGSLARLGLRYTVSEIIEFEFDVSPFFDAGPAAIGRSLSFLFSESLAARPPSETEEERIGEWVRRNAKERDGRMTLFTPDVAIWFFAVES